MPNLAFRYIFWSSQATRVPCQLYLHAPTLSWNVLCTSYRNLCLRWTFSCSRTKSLSQSIHNFLHHHRSYSEFISYRLHELVEIRLHELSLRYLSRTFCGTHPCHGGGFFVFSTFTYIRRALFYYSEIQNLLGLLRIRIFNQFTVSVDDIFNF